MSVLHAAMRILCVFLLAIGARFSARGSVLPLFTLHVASLFVPRPSSFFLACHVPIEGSTARFV